MFLGSLVNKNIALADDLSETSFSCHYDFKRLKYTKIKKLWMSVNRILSLSLIKVVINLKFNFVIVTFSSVSLSYTIYLLTKIRNTWTAFVAV